MKFALFYHSLLSDWNHGNAHFLRGIVTELQARGHEVKVYEPEDAWSMRNLLHDRGEESIEEFRRAYPGLESVRYSSELDLDEALDGCDVVIVHEWNPPELVSRIGNHRAKGGRYLLLFHDTHHRAVSAKQEMARYDLRSYDGVLAFGKVLRDIYLQERWTERAWVWHEAADTRVFHPMPDVKPTRDLVWIGNWGDDERTCEIHQFLIRPVHALCLDAAVYGVRYPDSGVQALKDAGIEYKGYLPNFCAPEVFAQFRLTVHIPRLAYTRSLAGIPTIRPFEALACGIPLISAPWNDCEHLFKAGHDYLVAKSETEMKKHMEALLSDKSMAREMARNGLETVRAKHTCSHRVDELLQIIDAR